MTLAAPIFLLAAVAAAAVVVGLHFLVRQQRRPTPLPTARFLPQRAASVYVRPQRLTHPLVLALRVAVLLLAGLALARPSVTRRPAGTAAVILADRSRGVANPRDVRRIIDSLHGPGTTTRLVAFDSVARVIGDRARDSDTAWRTVDVPGSLSAGLIAAIREGEVLRRKHATVTLHVVSPLVEESVDAATVPIRQQWRGDVVLHRVPAATRPIRGSITTSLPIADPLGAAVALVAGADTGAPTALVVRAPASETDRARVQRRGGVLVVWPPSEGVDTLAGVVTDLGVAIGHYVRSVTVDSGVTVAWWSDGTPAASEWTLGAGCVRSVGFSPSDAGDFALSPTFLRIVRRLTEPCGGAPQLNPASDSIVQGLRLASATPIIGAQLPEEVTDSKLAAWLLAGALALSVVELRVRRGLRREKEERVAVGTEGQR